MKYTAIPLLLILSILCCNGLYSVDKKQMEKWVNLRTEKDPNIKYQRLEEFLAQYGNEKNSQLVPQMYLLLNETAYIIKKYDKSIQYGEKALTFPEIEETQKLLILFRIANSFFSQNNYNKSLEYAQKVVEKGNALKAPANTQQMDTEIIAPALRAQARAINNQKPNDSQAMLEASQKALEAMKLDKSKDSDQLVRQLANMLKNAGKDSDYWRIVEELYQIKPDATLAKELGQYYSQTVKNDQKSLEYLLASYQLKKSGVVAYYLGILYNKANDMDNALNYMAEAYVQFDMALRDLYFKNKAKDQPLSQEEKEKNFQLILEAAKTRQGTNGSPSSSGTDIDSLINKQADSFVQIEKILQNIYLKKIKDVQLTQEEKEKGYQQLLDAARSRLGIGSTESQQ